MIIELKLTTELVERLAIYGARRVLLVEQQQEKLRELSLVENEIWDLNMHINALKRSIMEENGLTLKDEDTLPERKQREDNFFG